MLDRRFIYSRLIKTFENKVMSIDFSMHQSSFSRLNSLMVLMLMSKLLLSLKWLHSSMREVRKDL